MLFVLRIIQRAFSGQRAKDFISIFLALDGGSKHLSNPNECKTIRPPLKKSMESVAVCVVNIYNHGAWSLRCLHVRSNELKKAVKCPHDPLPSVWEGDPNSSCSSPLQPQASSKVSCQTGGAVIQPNMRLESRTEKKKKKNINDSSNIVVCLARI